MYIGKWYEIERSFAIFEMGLKCVTSEYTLNEDGTVKVINRGVKMLRKSSTVNIKSKYWVLDTDYKQYSLVISCNDVPRNMFHFEILWILSRKPTLDGDILTRIKNDLESRGIDVAGLKKTEQDCFK
ncbi:apolipoprotein D-like [Limulus polyphemus]|uniref:Apolipoprotein D-like n=1 Tax=Limulus polyphemus TaxID=6850 RepID=A0ABM1SSQ8_LIMPO|nr:apolipoprotein D-like [Limulus polyphemus]